MVTLVKEYKLYIQDTRYLYMYITVYIIFPQISKIQAPMIYITVVLAFCTIFLESIDNTLVQKYL